MHHSGHINPASGKPEIIEFYNASNGGVDALDQKLPYTTPEGDAADGDLQYFT